MDGFDVIVVGGGAAGCVVARRLAEDPARSVLLLEAGPDIRGKTPAKLRDGWSLSSGPDWPFDWGFESEPDARGEIGKLRRGRVLGGTSWLTRFAVRGHRADFDHWAAQGNAGWDFDGVLPTFRKLETDADLAGHSWHGGDGPLHITRYPGDARSDIHEALREALVRGGFAVVDDLNSPTAIGLGAMPMSSRDGARIASVDAYLRPEEQPPNLDVQADRLVDVVTFDGRRATGVRLADGTAIRADTVVLAAGTYGSPVILQRSGIGPAPDLRDHEIEIVADLPGVGANLADHPGVDRDTGWRGPGQRGPILHSLATWRSSRAATDAPDLMFWLTDPDGDDPAVYLDPILLKPDSRGSVRLRSADPTAPPRISLPGVTEPRDVERLAEGYELALEILADPALRPQLSEPPPASLASFEVRDAVMAGAYSIPHVVGTCRMGPSRGGGDVVDARGQVHGVDGLRVIDASIIPEPPSGFPYVITIMIAERLSAMLAAA
jgi:choline dehydrogenase